jgi:cardiolipin synthase
LSGILSLAAIAIVAVLLFLLLFEPAVAYRVRPPAVRVDTREFTDYLGALMDARLFAPGEVQVLSAGEDIFAAELAAIRGARRAIHLEAYLFRRGRVARAMLAALEERSRAGVRVRLIVDRYGSLLTPARHFSALRRAGGEVFWYQPIAWYTLKRLNNRTHRDLLIVDSEVGFVGGVGIADYWVGPARRGRPWREGRSTRARMLFQVLIASARASIRIASPYFVPDGSLCAELARAAQRGVAVTVVVPGRWNNHPLTRLASRRRYGRLLEAGLNDEVNLAVLQPALAGRLVADFAADLASSAAVSLEDWRRRGLGERAFAALARVLERQA